MPTPRAFPSSRLVAATLAVVGALTGCAKKTATTEAATAAALTIVQGNYQSVQAGKELPASIVLRVTDKNGTGMASVPVSLVVAEGGGTVTPPSGVSDAKGEYTAKWTTGPSLSDNQLRAIVPGLDPVKLYAVGIVPTDIIVAQGNNQTAKVGASLPTSIVVRVVGAGNVPMAGIQVLFQVISGGGSIAPQSAITSSLGEVTVKWTLGLTPGAQSAFISASTLTPVVLSATANP